MVEPDLSADLAFALELADAAAAVTRRWFGHRLPVELKEDATPVTEVDRAAERAVRDAVRARFPDDGVLGEEEGLEPGANGRCWVVDPVDGTKLYAEGIPLWTTMIGLLAVSHVGGLDGAFVAHSGIEEWIGGGRDDALARVAERARGTRGLSDAWVTSWWPRARWMRSSSTSPASRGTGRRPA